VRTVGRAIETKESGDSARYVVVINPPANILKNMAKEMHESRAHADTQSKHPVFASAGQFSLGLSEP